MLTKDTVLDNRYRIIRLLGQGGFGAVYEAIDEKFGEPIALKEISLLTKLSDEKQRAAVITAFRREAKVLAKARHETVPFVRDYFSEGDRQFLAMELVEGDELFELLEKRKSPFPVEVVLDWANQLLDALDYLHTLSPPIFHRDIKPQNLKVTSRGKIKLLDFGIAKVVETKTQINLAQKTMMAATREYSPIEQLLHAIEPMSREYFLLKYKNRTEKILKQKTDARCDIYALGATLFHLLTNQVPIDSTKRTTEIWEGKNDPMPIPSEINPNIPPEFSNFLLKAMAVERDNRFESAFEMQKALQEIISSKTRREEEAKRQIWIAEQERIKQEHEKLRVEQEKHLIEIEEKRQLLEKERNEHLKQVERENLQKEEEQKRISSLSQAQTEAMLEFDKPNEKEKTIPSNTLPSLTQPSNIQLSDTFSSDEISSTDYKLSDTDLSFDATSDFSFENTSDNLTNESYIDEEILNEQKETKAKTNDVEIIPPKIDEPTNNNRKYFLALPIIGLLTLVVGGGGIFGVYSWINSGETPTTIVETPEVTPSVEANTNALSTNTIANTEKTPFPENPETQKTPSVQTQPTSNPTMTPRPVIQAPPTTKPTLSKTPKTSKPVSTRKPDPTPTKDPRCVYTNSC